MSYSDRIHRQGPCAFHANLPAFHRIADAQIEAIMAGDHPSDIAADYHTDVETMIELWLTLAAEYPHWRDT